MSLTDRDIERRLDRNENDVVELYTMIRDVQRTVKAHDRRFDVLEVRLDGIDDRLGGVDRRLDGIDTHLDTMGTSLAEILQRLPEK